MEFSSVMKSETCGKRFTQGRRDGAWGVAWRRVFCPYLLLEILKPFSPILKKISFKFSPTLGGNISQIFSEFGRKSPSNFLEFWEKIGENTLRNVFSHFLPFSKTPFPCFYLFAPSLDLRELKLCCALIS